MNNRLLTVDISRLNTVISQGSTSSTFQARKEEALARSVATFFIGLTQFKVSLSLKSPTYTLTQSDV